MIACVFSFIPVATMWERWYLGDTVTEKKDGVEKIMKIPPYRRLNTVDLVSETEKRFLSKAKKVMTYIYDKMIATGVIT